MRFLNTETLGFEEVDVPEPKSYAVLSHTWGDGEVTFRDMADLETAKLKAGFDKIAKTCLLARLEGYRLAWVDTCCIDKSSSAELSEAINSMFSLYAESGKCFVYLNDYHSDIFIEDEFAACRWFTRGWTLQELIAPDELQFYQAGWQAMGTKRSLLRYIHDITRIPTVVLEDREATFTRCVAQRMSWAAGRVTRRPEDVAYCLLGLFGVNMPMLYGMGKKAFLRLQEEIIKDTNDLSIFAWIDQSLDSDAEHGVFAESPDVFRACSNLVFSDGETFAGYFSITNRGLRIKTTVDTESCPMPFANKRHVSAEEQYDSANDSPNPQSCVKYAEERLYRLRLYCRDPTLHDADIMLIMRKQGDGAHLCRVRCDGFVTAERLPYNLIIPTMEMFLAVTAQHLCPTGYLLTDLRSGSPGVRLDVIANFPHRHWDLQSLASGQQCRFRLTARFLGFSLIQISHHIGNNRSYLPPQRVDSGGATHRQMVPRVYLLVAFWLEPSIGGVTDPLVKCSIHCREPGRDLRFVMDWAENRAELGILRSPAVSLNEAQSILKYDFPGFGAQQSVYVSDIPRYSPHPAASTSAPHVASWAGVRGTVSVPETVRPMYHAIPEPDGLGLKPSSQQHLYYTVQVNADIK
ncbi:hypothetical protein MAPG_04598 [Magnaporthiopsis poae ATCC 64411]|uniref:Uncharacterized protein n=1 Tax=Magnaporthiopsis poae (strain ATCC 64411 / 73-15) TaxID=644358 RepID=A0A0C4DX60_MAGP6|nr:hypothetical protein MAPG_04598 [Magnaporthiopsis poae ATCC 64411]